jgi:serine/threonine protein kinase
MPTFQRISLLFFIRDLKCENILLAENLKVKIGDFGFARRFEEGGILRTCCGSFAYSSPELLRGLPYLGPPCDIWSMGVILFTCASINALDSWLMLNKVSF